MVTSPHDQFQQHRVLLQWPNMLGTLEWLHRNSAEHTYSPKFDKQPKCVHTETVSQIFGREHRKRTLHWATTLTKILEKTSDRTVVVVGVPEGPIKSRYLTVPIPLGKSVLIRLTMAAGWQVPFCGAELN